MPIYQWNTDVKRRGRPAPAGTPKPPEAPYPCGDPNSYSWNVSGGGTVTVVPDPVRPTKCNVWKSVVQPGPPGQAGQNYRAEIVTGLSIQPTVEFGFTLRTFEVAPPLGHPSDNRWLFQPAGGQLMFKDQQQNPQSGEVIQKYRVALRSGPEGFEEFVFNDDLPGPVFYDQWITWRVDGNWDLTNGFMSIQRKLTGEATFKQIFLLTQPLELANAKAFKVGHYIGDQEPTDIHTLYVDLIETNGMQQEIMGFRSGPPES